MNDNPQEQLSKNSLYSVGLDDIQHNSAEFMYTFQKSKGLLEKNLSFREVSDWQNRYQIENGSQSNKLDELFRLQKSGDLRYHKLSYLVSKKHNNESQSSRTKQRIELSPVNLRFGPLKRPNRNKLNISPGRSKQKQCGNQSFYQMNYEPLALLYEMKIRSRPAAMPRPKNEQLSLIISETNNFHLPRTERISSIMRLMKKQQMIRVHKQKHSYQKEYTFKLT